MFIINKFVKWKLKKIIHAIIIDIIYLYSINLVINAWLSGLRLVSVQGAHEHFNLPFYKLVIHLSHNKNYCITYINKILICEIYFI